MRDTELLDQFVQRRSPETFAKIFQRYSGMVYASALRQVGEAHLAEDVAQGVFMDLWRNVNSLKPGTVLVGWLLKATRYRAADALKLRGRREHHEKGAAQLKEDAILEPVDSWLDDLTPYLDVALASLSSRNREAVLLRFFEGSSMRGVSQRLGISEDAAKQRVSRSIEQLRTFFNSRGVVVPAAAVSQILASQANLPPLTGLMRRTIAALQTSAPKGVLITMAASKVKVATGIGVLLALLAGATAVGVRAFRHEALRTMIVGLNPPRDDWQANFNKLYGLSASQQVKFVPPPFPPERDIFWKNEQRKMGNAQPQGLGTNESLTIELDGSGMHWRSDTLGASLAAVLQNAVGIKRDDLDDSVPASMPYQGDWVVRKGASPAQVAEGISAILSVRLGRPVRLVRRNALRDTIIVRGAYHFVPLPGKADNGMIEILGDPSPLTKLPERKMPTQIRETTIGELLNGLCSAGGLPCVDQTGQSRLKVKIADHPIYGNPRTALRNVAAQMSLRLDDEPRERSMWFLVDATKGS